MPDEPLTPEQRQTYLDAIGWSKNQLIDALGMDERFVRRWFKDPTTRVPAEVDAWLKRRGEAMLADPLPRKPS